MITSRKLLSLAALVTLAATLLAGVAALAADVEIQVVPRDTQTEIGKTMVLDVDFTLPAGVVLPSSSLALEVITDGEGEILDEPYPLVFTSHPKEDGQAVLLQGPVKVEWGRRRFWARPSPAPTTSRSSSWPTAGPSAPGAARLRSASARAGTRTASSPSSRTGASPCSCCWSSGSAC